MKKMNAKNTGLRGSAFSRIGLAAGLVAGAAICIDASAAGSNSPPNIILIIADDLGYGDLGCYGALKIPTPEIDRLAAEGIRFTNAYAASSLCSPSRYSIMTGRYPWRTSLKKGVLTPFAAPLTGPDQTTLASLLKRAGYKTAYVGKWHLGFNWEIRDDIQPACKDSVMKDWGSGAQDQIDFSKSLKGGPAERGFDYFFGIPGSNNMVPYVFIEHDRVLEPPSVPTDFGNETLRAPGWDARYLDQVFSDKASTLINTHFRVNAAMPFFLCLATSAIHLPCLPALTKGMSKAGMRGDKVVELDRIVGNLVKTLKENKVLGQTLLIITSDNGPVPGDPFAQAERFRKGAPGGKYDYYLPYFHDFRPLYQGVSSQKNGWLMYGHEPAGDLFGFKSDGWEGGLRVPFIAHWPDRIKNGVVCHSMICLADLLSTFADLTGENLTKTEGEDSYSFFQNLVDNNAPQSRKSLILTAGRTGTFIVRKDNWKYMEAAERNWIDTLSAYPPPPNQYKGYSSLFEPHLYDLDKDIREQHNLYYKMTRKVAGMKAIIRKVSSNPKSEGS